VSEPVSIAGIAYAFANGTRTLCELEAAGQLESSAEVLRTLGFDRVHVASAESPYQLAHAVASRLMHETAGGIDPATIDALIVGGTPGVMAFSAADDADAGAASLCTRGRFQYPATRLQYELELANATVFAIDQLACTTLLGAVRLARALMVAEGFRRVLCVASEFFPVHAGREAIFNCTSDAACAVLVEAGGARNRVAAATSVTKGYYWDLETLRDEIVASYFPTAAAVIARTVAEAGWSPGDVDWVMPHNVSRRSWEILMGLARLPRARLWARNIARRGHTLAGDTFINLRDAIDGGDVRPGHRVLLFSYGFGAHWTGLAVEA
jgi:3-oxoacyl-[acyl-carrier-protein] synthase III